MHKNYQKRFYDPCNIYFITTNVKYGYPFFKDDQICNIFINTIKINKIIKQFKLFGFVVMTNHAHLLIKATLENNISEAIRSIKTNSSREINKFLGRSEGRVAPPDLRKPFGQPAPPDLRKPFGQPAPPDLYVQSNLPRFQWQERFYDHVIRNDVDFYNHLEYIFRNPYKHLGIKNYEDYKYSSRQFWQDLIDDYD